MGLSLRGQTSGAIDINAPNVAGDNTITLPGTNGAANQFYKNSGTAGIVTHSSMVEDSSGLVGIGSDNPETPLNVLNNNANTPTVWIRNTSTGGDSPALRVQGGANNDNAVGTFEVRDYAGNVDFKVGGTGKVGIGTDSPDSLLNISSAGNGYRFKIDDTTNDHTVGLYSDATTPRIVSVNNAEASYKPLTLSGADLRFWIGADEKVRNRQQWQAVG